MQFSSHSINLAWFTWKRGLLARPEAGETPALPGTDMACKQQLNGPEGWQDLRSVRQGIPRPRKQYWSSQDKVQKGIYGTSTQTP